METSNNKTLQSVSSPELRQPSCTLNVSSLVAAIVLSVFYLATSIYIAAHRLLWFDEVVTIRVARLPHWTTIWIALAHAVDSQPPIYYMVVRVFDRLFGHPEIALRLPSSLAMVAGLLITFDCVRRLTDGLHGLIALSVLTCSLLPGYAYLARPYTIAFMLAALVLWVWTCTRTDGTVSAICFGAIIFLGVTFHYYFVLCLVPYALWEISRWKPWQPPSPKLVAGVVGVVVSSLLISPLIMSFSRQFSSVFANRPSLFMLRGVFSDLFPDGLFLLALITVWIVLVGGGYKSIVLQPMQPSEGVSWLFLCIPLAGFVVAELKTNAFADRFFIGTLPGVAVAFSCWLWRHFRNNYCVTLGVLLLLATWGVEKQAREVRDPSMNRWQRETAEYMSLEDSLQKDGKQFTVFSAPSLYLDSEYYSKRPGKCILLLPLNAAHEAAVLPLFPLFQGVVFNLAQYYPLHFWKVDDLKKHASETALILPSMETLDAMRQAGFKIEVRFSKPLLVVYLK